jgi:hypothetical protein
MGSLAGNITTDQWLAAASHRRTVYPLKGTSSVSDDRVKEIIEKVLSFAPSSYNTQPVRITLVTGQKHKQFWDAILNAAEPVFKAISEDLWTTMSPRFEMFKASYGSVSLIRFITGDSFSLVNRFCSGSQGRRSRNLAKPTRRLRTCFQNFPTMPTECIRFWFGLLLSWKA